ncbi:MAG: glycosyltransferase [Deltaproteobacteria bacterium]|nr:glycosyltransferase [Deltaproteobacteria bacterium]
MSGRLPTVSIIVPAYNAEKTVNRCIEALLEQDYPAGLYDIVIVDDGSADNTGAVIKKYPVKYLHQKNKGPATARNKGAKQAKGEIILFTDSDCVPDKNWITEMVRPFLDNEKVAAVKGAYRTSQRGLVARFSQVEFEERFEMLKKVSSIDMVDTYSAGFRKEIFKKMGGFDTSFPVANNEDTELSYRMASQGHKMVFNPKAIVCHLNHPDSVKRYARIKFWRGYWRIVVYKKFPDKMLKDTYTPQALKFQILFLLLLLGSLPIAAIFPGIGIYFLLFAVAGFLVLSVPFATIALRNDPLVGIFSPFLLLMRAASIGSGAIWGVLRSRV